ncbi:MAG: tRNA (adenosine(37)-N6)-threonylcarbamoyltransferase complex dimerization subunit type 1 TsaB [Oscillospiraceae bacterium]|nr:tRNA (adenosine(37)-N6)-threonylcarbamoyltransferase complex dimerization subunit type 1 TsaB [Oscillospiraceae bacterium]MDD4413168.1 tRNA (adenosine(37)-N6)-threonylcarbamoyltransferase complex dimerization subunit type 1 TsaB [Oscillospiraceae bacterium]
MRILGIESSAGPASCAVWEDGRILACSSANTGLTHSQTLVPMIHDMLKNAGISLKTVDLLAVAAGPGSFTGVRIGVAAVKGLAFTEDKPCVGVSTLAAMARMAAGTLFSGIICPAMDARRDQVYTALFEISEGEVIRLTDDNAVSLNNLAKQLDKYKKPVLLIGDGAELCYNTFKQILSEVFIAPLHLRYQSAVGVTLEAAVMQEQAVSSEKLMPIYLRMPQAERELKRKLSNGK